MVVALERPDCVGVRGKKPNTDQLPGKCAARGEYSAAMSEFTYFFEIRAKILETETARDGFYAP
jgi:hypothetical protein